MNIKYNYQLTTFCTSVPHVKYLLSDDSIEVALVGYSNVGKSSIINRLTNKKHLSKISKIPGMTLLINVFEVKPGIRIVDLPGYGYAKVTKEIKRKLPKVIYDYLFKRDNIKGLILSMDIRHPMKIIDQNIIKLAIKFNIPLLILLTKADKLSLFMCQIQLYKVREMMRHFINGDIQVEIFSSKSKLGVSNLQHKLDSWFNIT